MIKLMVDLGSRAGLIKEVVMNDIVLGIQDEWFFLRLCSK